MMKAVILLSGGLDSVTCLAIAKSKDYSLYALTFRYGQRHQFEIGAAKECALSQQVENHIIMDIDLRSFGGSALTDNICLLYTSPSPRDGLLSRMPSSA